MGTHPSDGVRGGTISKFRTVRLTSCFFAQRAKPTRVEQRARRLSTHRPGTQITIRTYEQRSSPVRERIQAKVSVLEETKTEEVSSVLASGLSDEWLAEQWTELITRVRRRRWEISRERTRYPSRRGFFPCSRTIPRCRTGNTRRSPSSMALATHIARHDTPTNRARMRYFTGCAKPLFVQRQPPSPRCTRSD